MRKVMLAGLCLLVFASQTMAADLSGEPIIKRRTLFRGQRHEIAPRLGVTLLDHYQHHMLMGVSYQYFVFDWLGIGAEALYAAPFDSSLTKDIEAGYETQTVTTSSLQLLLNAAIELVPLAGKAMIMNHVLFAYDVHVTGGVGMAKVAGEGSLDDRFGFSPMFGGGMRFFLTPGIALSLDVRDYLVSMVEAGSITDLNKSADYRHNVAFMMAVDFLLPFETKASKN